MQLRLIIPLTAAAVALAACGGPGDEAATPPPEATQNPDPETIPVEELPDVLPEPFIFHGDELFGEEVEPEVEERIYTVEPGDTLALIAEAAGVTTEELQRLNGIADPSVLAAGDDLRIPVRSDEADRIQATLDTEAEDFSGPPPGDPYTVQPGDTLIDIATARGIEWRDLQSYNGLTEFEASNLLVGQVLIIPPAPEEDAGPTEPPG